MRSRNNHLRVASDRSHLRLASVNGELVAEPKSDRQQKREEIEKRFPGLTDDTWATDLIFDRSIRTIEVYAESPEPITYGFDTGDQSCFIEANRSESGAWEVKGIGYYDD